MPKFKITEGGKSYVITVPEGTTKEQAYGYLQQQLGGQSTEQPAAPRPWWGEGSILSDIGGGLGRAGAGTLADIGDLLPTIGPSTKEARDMLHNFAASPNPSGWGTAGEVAGNVLPFMLAPELGLGRLAIRGIPYGVGLADVVQAFRHGGLYTGLSHLPAAAWVLGGMPGMGHFSPKLAAVARALTRVAPRAAEVAGAPLEKAAAGAGTTYYRSQQEQRPTITIPRRATDGETPTEGTESRGDRQPTAPSGGPPAGATGGRGRSDDAATDQRPESRWVDPNYFPQTERGNP